MAPPVDSDAAHASFDAFEADLNLWENTLGCVNGVQGSSWVFHGSTTLYICDSKTINVIRANAPTLSALALLDTVYTYWEVKVHRNAKVDASTGRLASYHRALRHKVFDTLLQSKTPRDDLDHALQPWLIRTLCLFGHDFSSREAFAAVKRPSYLTEETITKTINQEVFREYVSQFIAPAVANPPFRCLNGQRSWEFLAPDPQIQRGPQQATKGIFIYPQERFIKLWDLVRRNPDFLRQGSIASTSIQRLNAGAWVDDEIINGYAKLLDDQNHSTTLIVTTFFYAKMCSTDTMRTTEIISWLKRKNTSKTVEQAIKAYDQIIIPINWNGIHWLVVVLDVGNSRVIFMDSLPEDAKNQHVKAAGHSNNSRIGQITKVLKERLCLGQEWSFVEGDAVPQQWNGNDCGVYCAQFIKFIYMHKQPPHWVEGDMLEIRNMMTLELYEQSLRWFTNE